MRREVKNGVPCHWKEHNAEILINYFLSSGLVNTKIKRSGFTQEFNRVFNCLMGPSSADTCKKKKKVGKKKTDVKKITKKQKEVELTPPIPSKYVGVHWERRRKSWQVHCRHHRRDPPSNAAFSRLFTAIFPIALSSPPVQAYITISGKRKHLGYYPNEKEAARTFDQQAALHGKPMNFPLHEGQEQAVKKVQWGIPR